MRHCDDGYRPSFATGKGFTGDGASSYINANFNLSAHAVAASFSNVEFGLWMLASVAASKMVLGDGSNNATGIRIRLAAAESPSYIGAHANAGFVTSEASVADATTITTPPPCTGENGASAMEAMPPLSFTAPCVSNGISLTHYFGVNVVSGPWPDTVSAILRAAPVVDGGVVVSHVSQPSK